MEGLWKVLLRATAGREPLSCEDCFMVFDYLSDLVADGYPLQSVLSLAERFLSRCPACHDELQHDLAELLLEPGARAEGNGHATSLSLGT